MGTSSGSIAVRPFAPDDAAEVVAMVGELAAFHGEDAAATASDLARHAAGPGRISTVWIAWCDGERCGFAATYDWMNYVGGFRVRNIDLFFVREGARGRGAGRALIEAIARDARSAGCRRITVGAEPDNEGANAFYRAMGFELRRPASNRYAASGEALDRLGGVPDAARPASQAGAERP